MLIVRELLNCSLLQEVTNQYKNIYFNNLPFYAHMISSVVFILDQVVYLYHCATHLLTLMWPHNWSVALY